MPEISPLREAMNDALDHIISLERGVALAVSPVKDPDQLGELRRAKASILKELKIEETVEPTLCVGPTPQL